METAVMNLPDEIEVVTTVEITHIYNGEELREIAGDIPDSPNALKELKDDFASAVKNDVEISTQADYVLVTNVQYFEKGGDEQEQEDTSTLPKTEEDSGEVNNG